MLASGLGACGAGGEDSTSTPAFEADQGQARVNAEVNAQNDAVHKDYQQRQHAEAPTSEEQEAEQAATDFYAILGSDEIEKSPNRTTIDSASFCELMSEGAQTQTIRYAKVSSGLAREWDCESAVELLVIRSKRTGAFKGAQGAEIIGVNAQGDKATATVRFGSGPVTSLPLVKEDGEWKLAANSVPSAP